ncbi:hypothetical protein Q427_33730 [Halomonas sp. BC04]|nr:hypothetical protein Q427_33730 [Halomonas sp. BC04]
MLGHFKGLDYWYTFRILLIRANGRGAMNQYHTSPEAGTLAESSADTSDDALKRSAEGLRGLARRLVEYGLLSRAAAERAEHEARESEVTLLQHLIDAGMVTARQGTLCAAWEYGLPIVDLDALRLASLPPAGDFPEKLLRKLCVVPLMRRSHRLTVAVPYPSTLAKLDELQFATGLSIEAVLCPVDQLLPVLEAYLAQSETSMMDGLDGVDDAVSELEFDEGVDLSEESNQEAHTGADDAPSSSSSTRSCWMPFAAAPRTFTSSPTRPATGCACVSTACCWRRRGRPSPCGRVSPLA